VPGATYVWSNGATTSSISVGTPGPYWVTADVGGCTASDTVVVGLHPEPGELNSLVEACPGDPVTLAVPIEGQSYLWSSGATTQAITVNAFGDYTFTVVDLNGCTWSGTGTVVSDPDNFEVWVPNVFSPNGDGENDRFEPQTGGPKDVQVTIYNRWGMEMFSSPNLGRLWDGRHDGRVVPDGTYFYIVSYRAACNAERTTEVGHVTVLR
jgi:gliding motility-associated-like protein